MSTQNDFNQQIDLAMGLAVDATCVARSAGILPLPQPHRRLLNAAIVALEKAQQNLFTVRNDPWRAPTHPAHRQLELL